MIKIDELFALLFFHLECILNESTRLVVASDILKIDS